ncbi:MAG TPA: 30S ribosomal protein S16 [Jiangellaceae bacterium]|nr:30S ribosomal protein S16 [Jiangellaceae bacterium]
MAVKIKLKRMGKIRNPQYRIIVADARTKRDGRAIEQIGKYHPKEEPSLIQVDSDRAQYWLGVGAQPTEPVLTLLKVTGDWQKYKGLPGAEGTLKVKEPKADKRARFDAALAEAHADPKSEATTPRKRAAKKAAAKAEPAAAEKPAKADKPARAKADTAKAEPAAAEKPAKADTARADKPAKADTAKADTAEKPAVAAETGTDPAVETDTAPTAEA